MTNPIDAVTALKEAIYEASAKNLLHDTPIDGREVEVALRKLGYTLTPIKPAEPQVELRERWLTACIAPLVPQNELRATVINAAMGVVTTSLNDEIRPIINAIDAILAYIAARGERLVPQRGWLVRTWGEGPYQTIICSTHAEVRAALERLIFGETPTNRDDVSEIDNYMADFRDEDGDGWRGRQECWYHDFEIGGIEVVVFGTPAGDGEGE